MQLSGKTIIVTGAASGIGAEVARLARFQGAKIIALDRNAPSLTVDAFHAIDLSDHASIDSVITRLPEKIDGLVNAAGVPGTAHPTLVARVNYLGLRHLTESLVERFTDNGAIVNIASILGGEWPLRHQKHLDLAKQASFADGLRWLEENPVAHETCYQYFKEALIVWSRGRAHDLFMQHNIRMNSVAPGPVFTPILGDFISMLTPERVERDAAKMKRPAYADEIAGPIVFLLSDQARWIIGANLPIDGGLAAA